MCRSLKDAIKGFFFIIILIGPALFYCFLFSVMKVFLLFFLFWSRSIILPTQNYFTGSVGWSFFSKTDSAEQLGSVCVLNVNLYNALNRLMQTEVKP